MSRGLGSLLSMAGSARVQTFVSRAFGLVALAPWGFCTVAAGWFPWGSPLHFSGGGCSSVGGCSPGVLVLWRGLWMSVARISSTLAIAYFSGETMYTQALILIPTGV
ncbi:hypothetical protein ILYODFUR_022006 [Ilyodon furcidens]|uniref:Uncharacterized protein n=1 Tax=Ilyodon furcidens TaxID=33524 RepID=A0ABV0U7E7_9TELE